MAGSATQTTDQAGKDGKRGQEKGIATNPTNKEKEKKGREEKGKGKRVDPLTSCCPKL